MLTTSAQEKTIKYQILNFKKQMLMHDMKELCIWVSRPATRGYALGCPHQLLRSRSAYTLSWFVRYMRFSQNWECCIPL